MKRLGRSHLAMVASAVAGLAIVHCTINPGRLQPNELLLADGTSSPASSCENVGSHRDEARPPQRMTALNTQGEFTCEVVRGGDQTSIVGATVYVHRAFEASLPILESALSAGCLSMEALRDSVETTVTDQWGRAHVSCQPGRVAIVALKDGELGMIELAASLSPATSVRLPCYKWPIARVRVVDQAGNKMLGVQVRIRKLVPMLGAVSACSSTRPPDGYAEVLVLGMNDPRSSAWIASIGGGLGLPAESIFAVDSGRIDIGDLVLPDFGSIEVRVQDESGNELIGVVYLQAQIRQTAGSPIANDEITARGLLPLKIDRVVLGKKMHVIAVVESLGEVLEWDAVGPERNGDTVVLKGELRGICIGVRGRAIIEGWGPLRRGRVEVLITSGPDSEVVLASGEADTDATGGFVLPMRCTGPIPSDILVSVRSNIEGVSYQAKLRIETVGRVATCGDLWMKKAD